MRKLFMSFVLSVMSFGVYGQNTLEQFNSKFVDRVDSIYDMRSQNTYENLDSIVYRITMDYDLILRQRTHTEKELLYVRENYLYLMDMAMQARREIKNNKALYNLK